MTNLNRAFLPRPQDIKPRWILINASNQIVGRLATQIAITLMGKNNELYTPSIKIGYHVVVINAEKVIFSGDKMEDKTYRKYTGYVGNVKTYQAKNLIVNNPTFILETAIKRMLPKNKLGDQLFKEYLKVYAGSTHPHQAQLA